MATLDKTPHKATIAGASVFVDPTYFPLIISGFIGAPTEAIMDRYWEMREPLTTYAQSIGTKIIIIADTTRSEAPSSVVRKYMADRSTALDNSLPCLHMYVLVVPNAVIRGVLTAISWVSGDKAKPTQNCPDFDSAVRVITKTYESLGIAFPRPVANYKPPI